MTQLIIDGVTAVLPQGFACTVKRENSFFTKSGEYTYDATLRLDNPVNRQLYGFLHRLNKTDEVDSNRPAILIADGHVYCRGTEVITGWTEETVSIQIVSGESEMNYFIGQDRKIEELDLGTIGSDDECAWPVVRTAAKAYINVSRQWVNDGVNSRYQHTWLRDVPSPMLSTLLPRIVRALGYTIGTNQVDDTEFRRLFLVNTIRTREYAKMIPGWTVKDFLSEVEKLTGVVFITDNIKKTCDIVLKTRYYLEARQLTLRNVVDAYEAEMEDGDSSEADFPSSNVSYDLPDHRWAKLMRLPEGLPTLEMRDYPELFQLLLNAWDGISRDDFEALEKKAMEPVILRDTSTGRKFVRMIRTMTDSIPLWRQDLCEAYLMEVDQMADLRRDEESPTLELKITPAPLIHFYQTGAGMELIDLSGEDGFFEYRDRSIFPDEEQQDGADEEPDPSESDAEAPIEDTIRQAEKKNGSSAGDLYCAFLGDLQWGGFPVVYTDGYHCKIAARLAFYSGDRGDYLPGEPEGSLRLKDLDSTYYQGGYEIDTRRAVTFETYDPNVIDPRQVYVIRNRRWVVRDIEEVVTAEGRQKKWKLTCYPIHVSDEAIEKRWVLTKGVWEDGAAWLDDGRWLDEPKN